MDAVSGVELATLMAGAGLAAVGRGVALRERSLAEGGETYRVVFPAQVSDGAMEQLLLGLHGALRPRLRRLVEGQPWLAIELHAGEAGTELRVWVPRAVGRAFLEAQFRAALPGARLERVDDDALRGPVSAGGWVVGHGAGLLRTTLPAPGISLLTTGLRGMTGGEAALMQLVVTPQPPRAQAHMQRLADQLLRGKTRKGGERVAPTVAERARAQRLQAKSARPLLSVSIRVLATASDRATVRRRVRTMMSGLHAFTTSELHFAQRRPLLAARFMRTVAARRRVRIPAATLLNSEELAAMLAVTPEAAREVGLAVAASRQLAAPAEIPATGRILGVAPTPTGERLVALSRIDSRRHLHVVGPTGVGKTELLLNLATQDIEAGYAVIVVDPKGGMTEELLRRMPRHRAPDLVLFSPADAEWPVALNPLEVAAGGDAERVCDDLVGILHSLYSDSWGPRLSDILKASLLTLVQVPGSTLVELPLLLMDDEFRSRYIERLDDPIGLGPFWAWWETLSEAARAEYCGPVLNKIRDWLVRPRLRRIIGASHSTIDIDQILNQRGILLVDLAPGAIGQEAAALLGSLIVSLIWQATRRRAMRPEHERPDAFVYLDELQDVAGLATQLDEALVQSRGFHVCLTMANQHEAQLAPALRQTLAANARSKAVFQTSAADARVLAREFSPHLTEQDLRGLGRFEIACALSVQGNTSRPFTARTLPAPPPIRTSTDALRQAARLRTARPRADADREIQRRLDRPTSTDRGLFGRRTLTDRPTDRPNDQFGQAAQPGQRTPGSGHDYSRGDQS